MRSIAAQMLPIVPDAVPYIYNDYVSKGRRPTGGTLRKILQNLCTLTGDLRLVIDGIDEVASLEHRNLLRDLLQLTKFAPNIHLLLVSQDISTISLQLSKQNKLPMSEERSSIEKDLGLIVRDSLEEIARLHGDQIRDEVMGQLESSITSRYSANDLSKVRRFFAWLVCNRGRQPLPKHAVRLGVVLHPGCTVIDQKTKPFANATEICKPLIEEGQRNSLMFVHLTVAQ